MPASSRVMSDIADNRRNPNKRLAAWAACAATDSPALIERFAATGYDVRDKTREDVEAVLRCPPMRAGRG